MNTPARALLDGIILGEGLPPQGDEHVRRYLEIIRAGEEAPPGLEQLAEEWVEGQAQFWVEAGDLITELEGLYPTPTKDEIVSGKAIFPPWHDSPWWDLLCHYPFAEKLGEAIENGKAAASLERSMR